MKFSSAFGDTAVEAVREVQTAMAAWLKELGKPIPKPKYRPAIYQAAP